MKKPLLVFVPLVVLLSLVVLPGAARANPGCAPDGGQIVVYFGLDGTQRYADSPGVGMITTVSVYGENFTGIVRGAQYRIDYGPCLQWIGDVGTPPGTLGNSDAGIHVSLPRFPLPGERFFIHRAFVSWLCECDSDTENLDFPAVVSHPIFGGPWVIPWRPGPPILAHGARSQTCQHVELDIHPSSCPNPFNARLWHSGDTSSRRGGVLPVAILGSETVDVSTIDLSSVRLEGVEPLPLGLGVRDVSTLITDWWDRVSDCVCNDENGDGWPDLTLKFSARDIAAAIPEGSVGDVIPLTLTACYDDGMPFSATDCVTVVGNVSSKVRPTGDAGMGFPTPNPFNPVTRIDYTIPETQHVRIAIYDVAGRLVDELVNEVQGAGDHVVAWDAGDHPSGVYFYRLQAGSQTIVRRMTLLK